jgi:uncharacterized membrane protein SirB2
MWLTKVHMGLALSSVTLFFIRGLWMMADSPMRQQRLVKIAPHVIDTLLLLSAIVLVAQTRQYPWEHSWLAAKVIALLVYIGIGLVAMRLGRSKQIRVFAWLLALTVFGYMLLVATHRNPLPLPG